MNLFPRTSTENDNLCEVVSKLDGKDSQMFEKKKGKKMHERQERMLDRKKNPAHDDISLCDCLEGPNIHTRQVKHQLLSELFNPFPNKPWFLHVCSTSLLKTLRE